MKERHNVIIESPKFNEFLKTHGKTKEFWTKNEKIAKTEVSDEELNQLFNEV